MFLYGRVKSESDLLDEIRTWTSKTFVLPKWICHEHLKRWAKLFHSLIKYFPKGIVKHDAKSRGKVRYPGDGNHAIPPPCNMSFPCGLLVNSWSVKGSYRTVNHSLHRYLFIRGSKLEIQPTIEAEKILVGNCYLLKSINIGPPMAEDFLFWRKEVQFRWARRGSIVLSW